MRQGITPIPTTTSRPLSRTGSAPAPRSPEPGGLGLSDRPCPLLAGVRGNDGGVVLLVGRQGVGVFAGPADVALDARVVGERDLLLDGDVELGGEALGAVAQ